MMEKTIKNGANIKNILFNFLALNPFNLFNRFLIHPMQSLIYPERFLKYQFICWILMKDSFNNFYLDLFDITLFKFCRCKKGKTIIQTKDQNFKHIMRLKISYNNKMHYCWGKDKTCKPRQNLHTIRQYPHNILSYNKVGFLKTMMQMNTLLQLQFTTSPKVQRWRRYIKKYKKLFRYAMKIQK